MTPDELWHWLSCQEGIQNHNLYLQSTAADEQARFNSQLEAEQRRIAQLQADERWRQITLSTNCKK